MVRVKNKTNVLENETPVRKHGFKKKNGPKLFHQKMGASLVHSKYRIM